MYSISPPRWLALLPLLAALSAIAQDAAPLRPAASSTSQPAVPGIVTFRSAFQDYQPFAEEEQVPWKDANETVRKIGGWREYAKEAAAPAAGNGEAAGHEGHHPPQPTGKP